MLSAHVKTFFVDGRNLVSDSRQVMPGDVFVACRGAHVDGRHYIDQAVQRGAGLILYDPADNFIPPPDLKTPMESIDVLEQKVASLAEQFYEYPSTGLKLVGVTGTNGKTSVTQLLAQALHALRKPCGVLGTIGNGVWPQLVPSGLTTLDPCALQKIFHQFRREHCDTVAMEVSSHGLDQNRLGSTQLDIGVFTNFSQDHLDYHHTMAEYGLAKAKMFDQYVGRVAMLNADDAQMALMRSHCAAHLTVMTFGIAHSADIQLQHHQALPEGFAIRVATPWGSLKATVALLGTFNLSNILAVIGILGNWGYSVGDITTALSQCHGVTGRMEFIHQQPLVIIDYSHTPDALQKALQAARVHCKGKLMVVLGCGGDRDRGKRPMMARIAEQYADVVMVTEDNPRTEDPLQIVADMITGFHSPKSILFEPNRVQAIARILSQATTHDTVLLAGKGHECYIIRGGTKEPFSEHEVVRSFYRR